VAPRPRGGPRGRGRPEQRRRGRSPPAAASASGTPQLREGGPWEAARVKPRSGASPMTHERRLPLPSPYFIGFALNSTAISRAMSDHVRFFFASFSDAAAAAPLPHTLDQSMHINCSQRAGWGAGRSSHTFRSVACHHRGRLPCRAEGLVTRRSHSSGCCARTRPSRSARAARRAARWWRWWASTWPVGVDRYLAG
jgi:hypothetical protein